MSQKFSPERAREYLQAIFGTEMMQAVKIDYAPEGGMQFAIAPPEGNHYSKALVAGRLQLILGDAVNANAPFTLPKTDVKEKLSPYGYIQPDGDKSYFVPEEKAIREFLSDLWSREFFQSTEYRGVYIICPAGDTVEFKCSGMDWFPDYPLQQETVLKGRMVPRGVFEAKLEEAGQKRTVIAADRVKLWEQFYQAFGGEKFNLRTVERPEGQRIELFSNDREAQRKLQDLFGGKYDSDSGVCSLSRQEFEAALPEIPGRLKRIREIEESTTMADKVKLYLTGLFGEEMMQCVHIVDMAAEKPTVGITVHAPEGNPYCESHVMARLNDVFRRLHYPNSLSFTVEEPIKNHLHWFGEIRIVDEKPAVHPNRNEVRSHYQKMYGSEFGKLCSESLVGYFRFEDGNAIVDGANDI